VPLGPVYVNVMNTRMLLQLQCQQEALMRLAQKSESHMEQLTSVRTDVGALSDNLAATTVSVQTAAQQLKREVKEAQAAALLEHRAQLESTLHNSCCASACG
jgi:ABC-type transporter Mla subunit MlaD